jgi:NAD/NADP transhydrogenase beta subunit
MYLLEKNEIGQIFSNTDLVIAIIANERTNSAVAQSLFSILG